MNSFDVLGIPQYANEISVLKAYDEKIKAIGQCEDEMPLELVEAKRNELVTAKEDCLSVVNMNLGRRIKRQAMDALQDNIGKVAMFSVTDCACYDSDGVCECCCCCTDGCTEECCIPWTLGLVGILLFVWIVSKGPNEAEKQRRAEEKRKQRLAADAHREAEKLRVEADKRRLKEEKEKTKRAKIASAEIKKSNKDIDGKVKRYKELSENYSDEDYAIDLQLFLLLSEMADSHTIKSIKVKLEQVRQALDEKRQLAEEIKKLAESYHEVGGVAEYNRYMDILRS